MRRVWWKGGAISLPERVLSIVFGIASTTSSLDCLLRHHSEGSFFRLFLIPNSSSTKEHSDSSSTKEHSRQQLDESPAAARRTNSPQLDESPTAARRKNSPQLDESPTAARRTNSPQLDERTLHSSTKEHSGSSSTNKQLSSTKKDHGSSTDKHRITG